MPHGTNENMRILLIEDELDEGRSTGALLNESSLEHHVTVVQDGAAALAYLRRENPYATAPRPDLILLDLVSLSEPTGIEVLEAIKADPRIQQIPVVVLTNTRLEYCPQPSGFSMYN